MVTFVSFVLKRQIHPYLFYVDTKLNRVMKLKTLAKKFVSRESADGGGAEENFAKMKAETCGLVTANATQRRTEKAMASRAAAAKKKKPQLR